MTIIYLLAALQALFLAALLLAKKRKSGAERAMLFTQWQEPLQEHYQFIKRDVLKGGDTHTQMGDVVLVKRMNLSGLNYDNMTFRFNDIGGNSSHTMPFDGLLGYEFLASRPTAINFRARQLKLWPAKS